MINPIQETLSRGNIMIRAVGAWLRGESPQQFLQNLAKTEPSLQDLDLEHPGQTAETLYQQQGKDIAAAKKSVMDNVSQFLAK